MVVGTVRLTVSTHMPGPLTETRKMCAKKVKVNMNRDDEGFVVDGVG